MTEFANPGMTEICQHLKTVRTIAVVGLSPKPGRPSFGVSQAMQRFGYRIIPVRPLVSEVLGEKAYARLSDVPDKIDLVNVFRAAEHIPAIVEECLQLQLPAIWIQEGIHAPEAALRAREAGMWVVMDRCIYRDYAGYCL